jgi:hypothetical protein
MLNDTPLEVELQDFGTNISSIQTSHAFKMVVDRARQWTVAELHLTTRNFQELAQWLLTKDRAASIAFTPFI